MFNSGDAIGRIPFFCLKRRARVFAQALPMRHNPRGARAQPIEHRPDTGRAPRRNR
jgi:hypothetical protein